jgi:ankyrin repeat protein
MKKNDPINEIKVLLKDPEMWEYNHHLNFLHLFDIKTLYKTKKLLLKALILMKLGELSKASKYLKKYLLTDSKSIYAEAFLENIYNKCKKTYTNKESLSIFIKHHNMFYLDILGAAIILAKLNHIEESLLKLLDFIKSLKINTTILHIAVEYNISNLINYIIKKYNQDIDLQDYLAWTPLHWAAWLNNSDIISILIKNGANIDAKGKNNETPIYLAAFKGNIEAVKILLDNKANVEIKTILGNAPLHMASYNEHIEVISMMLSHKADIDIRTDVRYNSALHIAAWHGKIKSAVYLLDNGSDINAKTVNGCTPLHRAALNGQKSIIELLITRGVDINTYDELGRTPLYCAYKNKHLDAYNILLKRQ